MGLSKFVLKLANSKEHLYSKFEEGLFLEIKVKMSITGTQSYKEVVQLALGAEKLTGKKMSHNSFHKRKGFNFILGQSLKKSRSSEFSRNSSSLGFGSVGSP